MAETDIIIAVAVSAVVSIILFLVLRGETRATRLHVGHIEQQLGLIEPSQLRQGVESLRTEFVAFGQDVLGKVDAFKRLSAEEMGRIREDVTKLAEQRSVDAAVNHVRQISVTREEFQQLRVAVQRLGGYEESAERIELIRRLFESTDLRVLTWQTRLIRLLEGGLAPEAEQDQMLANGIPLGAGKDFLHRMDDFALVAEKRVASYWLQPDALWLLSYTQDALWLKRQLEASVRKEEDYQRSVRDHLALVEQGLMLVAEQYELPSGRVDLLARDAAGGDVLLELKYPTASSAAVGQLPRYREEYARAAGGRVPRAMLVAPTISERMRTLLQENGLDCREVPEGLSEQPAPAAPQP